MMAIRLLLDQFYVSVKIRWAAIVTDFQICTELFNNLKKIRHFLKGVPLIWTSKKSKNFRMIFLCNFNFHSNNTFVLHNKAFRGN